MAMTIDELGAMIGEESKRTQARFDAIDEKFEAMDGRFDAIDERFDAMDERFERVDERFDRVDERFDRLEKRMMNVEVLAEDSRGDLIEIKDRVSKIEYTLIEANPRELKKRTEKLEKRIFGSVKPA